MNLQPIYPTTPDFTAPCLGCGRTVSSSSGLADLDGGPFKAYYCSAECASGPEPWRTVENPAPIGIAEVLREVLS